MQWFNFNFSLPITDPTWIFFLVLIIILFAPIILNRLHIPHIIGMILAGVVIGPYGFDVLARDSSFELFGKVGLYYIMFLAALEMKMSDFRENKYKTITYGILAFIIPMIIGFVANISLLKYGVLSSILLASMYASHTLVAYPIVIRFGLSHQRSVNIAVGATAITDTLTLMVLAVVGGMFKGEASGFFWVWLIVKTVGLYCLIVFSFPRIARWFFRRYDDNVMQFIFVLAMVFFGAGLMEFVGMEGILGAFLVGLVLNRYIPHVSPLMNHLEFVGNAIFIPYFLIGVGMLINVHLLLESWSTLEVAGIMIIFALTTKWVASYITQHLFRMKAIEREMIFGLSSAQAAATLAAVLIGHGIIMSNGERLLNDDVLNGTVAMILVTCLVSSLVTEHHARKFALAEKLQTPDEAQAGQTVNEQILIPIANPETIDYLINLALVVKNQKQHGGLVALSVINDSNNYNNRRLQAQRNLELAGMTAAAANVSVKTVSRYDINIVSGIVHTIKEYNVTDLIVGLHRKANIVDSAFGNIGESLLKNTHRQIIIAKFLMPVNTIRRIHVAVPPKAEYESGFVKWIKQLTQMSDILGCRIVFHSNNQTLEQIQLHVKKLSNTNLSEYSRLDSWDELLILTGQVNFDHLLVIVSARKGTISYNTLLDKLPSQISKYFNNNSLMILYPDQYGEPQEIITFSEPRGYVESQHFDKLGNWFYKWLKKE